MNNDFMNWFNSPGAYVLVDGQFGSTGKGLFAAYLAGKGAGRITHCTTNAGPNSGHTAYFNHEKIVTQQIPVASVVLKMLGGAPVTILNAGAVIDENILDLECEKWGIDPYIHPRAAIIDDWCRIEESVGVQAIASTGKGVGAAIERKISRRSKDSHWANGRKIWSDLVTSNLDIAYANRSWDNLWRWNSDVVFVETAQGFSLGVHSKFYPYVTSRECTVMQALADARIPAQMLKRVVACFRTYPIRVGNTEKGYSGDFYKDQRETSWETLKVTPELTTVTKRVRRVFTFSMEQFEECIAANRPDSIFLNFCNYMQRDELKDLINGMVRRYNGIMGHDPVNFVLGYGPMAYDIYPMGKAFYG